MSLTKTSVVNIYNLLPRSFLFSPKRHFFDRMKNMNFIFIYITNPTEEEARKIASHLLEKKLIACANIFPINSLYRWQGKIRNENEFVLIAKTIEDNFEKIKNEVENIHSYKTPCLVKISVSSNEKYYNWLKEQLNLCQKD